MRSRSPFWRSPHMFKDQPRPQPGIVQAPWTLGPDSTGERRGPEKRTHVEVAYQRLLDCVGTAPTI